MIDSYTSIKEITLSKVNSTYSLPSSFHSVLNFLERGHLYWWMLKDYTLLKRTEGAVLDYLSDYSLCIRIALIAKCCEDLLHQYKQLFHAYQNLKHTFYRNYPCYQVQHWKVLHSNQKRKLSAAFHVKIYLKSNNFIKKQLLVLSCVGAVLKELFKLSAKSNEIYLIINGNALARYGAYTDLAANWKKYSERLSNHHADLVEELKKMQSLIDSILVKSGLNKRSIDLIHSIENLGIQAIGQMPRLAEIGEEILAPVYHPGKVTPIDFGFRQESPPVLPPAPAPHWKGERSLSNKTSQFRS